MHSKCRERSATALVKASKKNTMTDLVKAGTETVRMERQGLYLK
jgi:hypothetical protein